MEKNKKLGLGSVVSVSVGLVIATSCLVSLGQGAGTVGIDRKSTRLNSSHMPKSRMPSSA